MYLDLSLNYMYRLTDNFKFNVISHIIYII